jgi:hydrogenase nickel incorporation protein HypA/HybF
MHEVDMTRCLLLSMQQWRQQHAPQVPQVSRVQLQVGRFTCVEPDQLVTTWRAAVQGSWLDGAELAIETVPLIGRCLACQGRYSPEPERAYRSPCCDRPLEEIISGRELRILRVEYDLAAADTPEPGARAAAAPRSRSLPSATASAV